MKKILSIVILSFFVIPHIWAVNLTDLMKCVSEKDQSGIEAILENANKTDLSEYESYLISQAKEKILKGEYDEAALLTEAVLSVDFENKTAQDLYTSIEKAKKDKVKEKKEKEAFEAKKKKEEKAKISADKAAEEDAYWKKIEKFSFANFPMTVGLAPVAFDIQTSDLTDNSPNSRYGLGFDIGAGYISPNLKLNVKLEYLNFPVKMDGKGDYSTLNLRGSISASRTKIPIALTAGYKNRKASSKTSLYTDLGGMFIGAGLDQIQLTDFLDMNAFIDWNLCSFTADSMIKLSAGAEHSIRFKQPIKNTILKWYIESRTKFDIWKIQSHYETCTDTALSAGIMINGR